MPFATTDLFSLVDFSKSSLTMVLLSIAFNPTAWNIVARNGASLVWMKKILVTDTEEQNTETRQLHVFSEETPAMAATSSPFLFFPSVCSVIHCAFQLPRATRKRNDTQHYSDTGRRWRTNQGRQSFLNHWRQLSLLRWPWWGRRSL